MVPLSSSAEVPIILSQTLQNPNLDSPARIEILRREHIGSRDHPHGCRPCHFQGGLCWKGLSCTFCHICPKPVRKSKHQRDVDRRRAERYRQVRDDLGTEAFNRLMNIDDMRRLITQPEVESSSSQRPPISQGMLPQVQSSQVPVESQSQNLQQSSQEQQTSVPMQGQQQAEEQGTTDMPIMQMPEEQAATQGVIPIAEEAQASPERNFVMVGTDGKTDDVPVEAEIDDHDSKQEKINETLICPITHEKFTDPVFTCDGHTYEREAIENWLKNNKTSPLTGIKLKNKTLTPNHALKSLL